MKSAAWEKNHRQAWRIDTGAIEMVAWFEKDEFTSIDITFKDEEKPFDYRHPFNDYFVLGTPRSKGLTLTADEFRQLMGAGSAVVLELRSRFAPKKGRKK